MWAYFVFKLTSVQIFVTALVNPLRDEGGSKKLNTLNCHSYGMTR
jgi:hypothetical protein